MARRFPIRWSALLLVAPSLAGCSAGVMLVEAFTDIDEHIAREMRTSEDGQPAHGLRWVDDDELRFPAAAENCEFYSDLLDTPSQKGLLEREYLDAMRGANCRASH